MVLGNWKWGNCALGLRIGQINFGYVLQNRQEMDAKTIGQMIRIR